VGNHFPAIQDSNECEAMMKSKSVDQLRECNPDISSDDLRDPEDRPVSPASEDAVSDKMMDKTLADTYPASDPPSSIPDPHEDSFRLDCVPHAGKAA
jgi:hypothetical protein